MSEEEKREIEAKEKRAIVMRALNTAEALFGQWYGYSNATAKEVNQYFHILKDIACVCTLKGVEK